MTFEKDHLPEAETATSPGLANSNPSLESLRGILFGQYRQQIAELEAELDDLERRIADEDALIAIIAPVIGDVMRRKIRDARDEMIEVLYPIIGQTVVRAVGEAIRDLVRNVDAQMRRSLNPGTIWQRLRARARGVSSAEMVLRESLPFQVAEVFLIHRETGLLLRHISHDPDASPDSDLISSMLTAIRDFVQDAFGRGEEGHLDEIQSGGRRILIETSQHAYLAVVVDGVEPIGFRTEMRERIIGIDHAHERTLRDYSGDASPLAPAEASLRSLFASAESQELSPPQKRAIVGVLSIVILCLVIGCLAGRWGWQALYITPTPIPVTVEPTATFTVTPSPTPTATPSPTPTPRLSPTPSPALTPTPAPVMGAIVGNIWVREDPAFNSPLADTILEQGQPVEILAVFGDWCQVSWVSRAQIEVTGWVPSQWVGTMSPIPARIIAPTPSS